MDDTTTEEEKEAPTSSKLNFGFKEMEALAGRLVTLLQDLVSRKEESRETEEEEEEKEKKKTSTRFNAPKIPKISLARYIERMMHYCPTSKSAWIVSFIYIKRVLERCGDDFIHDGSVHRLLLTSMVLGSKFCDDDNKENAFYARVGGLSTEELNDMEVELLSRLEYRLYVEKSEYAAVENSVCPEVLLEKTDMKQPLIGLDGKVGLQLSSLFVSSSSSSGGESMGEQASSSSFPSSDSVRQLASFFSF